MGWTLHVSPVKLVEGAIPTGMELGSWGTSPNPPARETTATPERRNASKERAETLPLPRLFSVLASARKPNGFLRRCLAR